MPVKNINKKVDVNSRWLQKRGENFRREQEAGKDIEYAKRQKIAERIKSAGIKLKNVYKAKLGEDMRAFEYKIVKIDRISGEVSLKNERATVRKVHVLDPLFGKM
jgi:hypothetical protein